MNILSWFYWFFMPENFLFVEFEAEAETGKWDKRKCVWGSMCVCVGLWSAVSWVHLNFCKLWLKWVSRKNQQFALSFYEAGVFWEDSHVLWSFMPLKFCRVIKLFTPGYLLNYFPNLMWIFTQQNECSEQKRITRELRWNCLTP
jgi:hypothetical protein